MGENNTISNNNMENMLSEAKSFDAFRREFFLGKKTPEDLLEVTTQPFWESMCLHKNRLDECGLVMDHCVTEEVSKGNGNANSDEIIQDGSNVVGMSTARARTNRTFFQKGRKVYRRKDKEKRSINLLKTVGEGDQVTCPNCGHTGTIASFIDGCDYCNAKFTVQEFRPKVSGYYVTEDPGRKTKSAFWKILGVLGLVTFALIFLGIISLIIIVIGSTTQTGLMGTTNSIITFLFVERVFPMVKSILMWSIALFGITGAVIYINKSKYLNNTEIVTDKIRNMSLGSFAQSLEYVLRNIHFSRNYESVSPFLRCDAQKELSAYNNVIECTMTKIRFLNLVEHESDYDMRVLATMRLSRFNGRKVKDQSEQIELLLTGQKKILNRNVSAIREYKCPNCAGSVSLLHGGVCTYCGAKLDYADYGWVIREYCPRKKIGETYKLVKWGLVVLYLGILIASVTTFWNSSKEEFHQITSSFSMVDVVDEFLDDVTMPEDVCDGLTLSKSDLGYLNRKYEYESQDAEAATDQYVQYMAENEGYLIASQDVTSYMITKQVEIAGQMAQHQIKISFYGDTIRFYEDFEE